MYSGLFVTASWARVPPLARRQLLLVFPQRPHAAAEGGGLVAATGGAQFPGEAAAQFVQLLPRPLDDVEGVIPTSG